MPQPEGANPIPVGAPPAEPGAAPATEENPASAAVAAPATAVVDQAKYGLGIRVRWVSVPSWFLGLFTQKSVSLSSYSYALEGYRRKVDRDDPHRTWELSAAVGFQNMSPNDGYWLGKGKDITLDTDLVQAKNFSLITMDAAFISRQYFSPYFGIHYGAGLGLAVVRGKILRTSAVCDQATGQCHVQIAQAGDQCGGPGQAVCTEANLAASQGQGDQAGNGHRFQETSIPGAIPIINLLFGLDFPIPDAKGLEFRIEGGFFDAFFVGGTAGYVF
ncbi:MAG TPA: hypothetical protein VF524_10325 [Polyangia bacterium]